MTRPQMTAGVIAAACLSAGCLAYNQECSAPSDLVDPDSTIGHLTRAVTVAESNTRTRETEVGNLIADAYVHAYNDPTNPSYRDTVPPVDAAFENAGGIREEGFCTTLETLPSDAADGAAVSITRADLREVMRFSNRIVVVELNGAELHEVFEHGVSALASEDPERGFFLQVSAAVAMTVDCQGDAQEVVEGVITRAGSRITALSIGGTPVVRTDTASVFRLATNDFLVREEGNDGFVTLAGRPRFNSLGKFSPDVVEDFLGLNSSEETPYDPPVGGRITLENCD